VRADRRLAKLEASLPPREAVFRWLADAHQHGSLDAYLVSLLDEPGVSPLMALTERVAAATRAAQPREPRPIVREAERRAVMDTVFLLTLVLDLEREASEVVRLGRLRLTALQWERQAHIAGGSSDRRGWAAWRTGVLDLASDLARGEAVRLILADRYLAGREVLSPAALAAWAELGAGVAALVSAMPSLPRSRRGRRPDGDVIRRAAERTAPDEARALVERVRARALDLLGDHAGAVAIVEGALRSRP
jgi:hypothetical protein